MEIEIPEFASEQEEAEWWDAHPEVFVEAFRKAKQEGRVRRLSQTDLPGAAEAAFRVRPQELARAKALAAKHGIPYQTYLERLVHEALDSEEKKLGR